jgi:hypothetical protein
MTYSAQIFVAIEYTRDKPNENGQKKRVFKPVIIRESSSPSSYEQYTRIFFLQAHHHTSSIRAIIIRAVYAYIRAVYAYHTNSICAIASRKEARSLPRINCRFERVGPDSSPLEVLFHAPHMLSLARSLSYQPSFTS